MRAYLRLDPGLPDHKADYPDGAFRAFVEILCLAVQQPRRGYFRSQKLLRVLLERRARWIQFLIEREDLLVQADGSLYVDGWTEWQEGDTTVPERMARLRARKRGGVSAVTPDVTPPNTPVAVTQRQTEALTEARTETARRNARRPNGSPPPEPKPAPFTSDQRDRAIAENQAILDDPRAAEAAKRAALQTLQRLGAWPSPEGAP